MDRLIELFRQTLVARGRSANTIRAYLAWLLRFALFVTKPLDKVTIRDLQAYQRHLATQRKIEYSTFNQGFCALRSFYRDCLQKDWDFKRLPFQKQARKLPEILSAEEVLRLFQASPSVKHRVNL